MLLTPDVKDEVCELLANIITQEHWDGVEVKYLVVYSTKCKKAEYTFDYIEFEYTNDLEEFLEDAVSKHNDSKDNFYYTFILDYQSTIYY